MLHRATASKIELLQIMLQQAARMTEGTA